MTYRIVPCPKCNRLHGVVAVRASKRGPAKPYDGLVVSPLRSETPCDGRESSLSDTPPLGRSRSRSSQAASRVTSRRLGATG